MKRLIIFLLLFAAIKVAGQTTGYLRFDTVKIMKQNGTCELYIINKTKDTLGLLTNVGGGLTQFRKSRVLNDSTIVVGLDTLVIVGGSGGGGGSGSVTSISQGYGITNTPNPITSTGTIDVDTLNITTIASRDKLKDSLQANINLKVNISDTSTMLANYIRDANDGLQKTGQVASIANNGVTTAKIADNNVTNAKIAPFKTYPAEKSLGVIYEKSQWSDISGDFQPNSAGTNLLSISTGYLNSSAAAFSYNNYVRILPGRPTAMNRWKMTVRFRNTAWSANSFEFGVGIYSAVTHSGAAFGYIAFLQTTSSGSGNLFIYDQSGAVQRATGSGTVTYALNDDIELTYTYNDTTLVFTAQNITTGGTLRTATYTFPANQSVILPNNGNWGLFEGNGGTGTHQVRYIKIESLETQYPNLLIIGNSKTKGYYSDFYNLRFPSQLNSTYPTVVWNAGSAERLTDMLTRLDEFTQLNASTVWLVDAASNQLRAGTSIADTWVMYDQLTRALEGGGATVLHSVLPEDSTGGGLGQTAWNALINAKYPGRVINTYDDMSTNNVGDAVFLNADKVHLNQAGHNQVVATAIASGLLTTISTQRRAPYRVHDDVVKFTGDSLHFRWKMRSLGNRVLRYSTNNDEITTGPLYMDSLDVILSNSTRPAKPLSTMKLSVEGAVASYGSQSTYMMFDRTTPTNYYSLYPNANTLNFNYTGTDVAYMGTDGRFRIGNGSVVSTTIPSRFQLKGNWGLTNSTPGYNGQLLNVDTTTMTFTGATGLGDISANSFGEVTMASTGVSNGDTVSNLIILNSPTDGTNFTSNKKLALYVRKGESVFNSKISVLNSPSGYGAYRLAVINPDSTLGTVPSTTFATQSALNDTAAAIRSDIGSPVTPNYEMFYSDNSTTTVGNTTTEATLLGTGTGTAQFTGATAGCVLSIKGSGILSTAASAGVPTLEFTVSNYTVAHNLTGLTGSLSNIQYDYDFEIIPVSIGTNQDAIVNYTIRVNDGASGKIYSYSTRLTTSFTSSGTLSVDVTADWDAADAANTLTAYKNVVQIFRK